MPGIHFSYSQITLLMWLVFSEQSYLSAHLVFEIRKHVDRSLIHVSTVHRCMHETQCCSLHHGLRTNMGSAKATLQFSISRLWVPLGSVVSSALEAN